MGLVVIKVKQKKKPTIFGPMNRCHCFYEYFQDALPMINKLRFEEAFRPAMQLVFGKTLVCRNLEVASQFSKSENMDCITLEGTCLIFPITICFCSKLNVLDF